MIKYIKKYQEIIRYCVIGGISMLITLVSYYLLVNTLLDANNGIQLQIANIISWLLAVIFAYFANRSYVFSSKNINVKREFASFFLSRLLTLFFDVFLMFLLVTFLGFNDRLMKIIVEIIITITNYLTSKFIVFKK